MGLVGNLGHFLLGRVEAVVAFADGAVDVAERDIAKAIGQEEFGNADTGRTGTVDDDLGRLF